MWQVKYGLGPERGLFQGLRARQILNRGGHYLMVVKNYQLNLCRAFKALQLLGEFTT